MAPGAPLRLGRPAMTAHPRVVACARSLTHFGVRSLTCSAPPWAALALAGRQSGPAGQNQRAGDPSITLTTKRTRKMPTTSASAATSRGCAVCTMRYPQLCWNRKSPPVRRKHSPSLSACVARGHHAGRQAPLAKCSGNRRRSAQSRSSIHRVARSKPGPGSQPLTQSNRGRNCRPRAARRAPPSCTSPARASTASSRRSSWPRRHGPRAQPKPGRWPPLRPASSQGSWGNVRVMSPRSGPSLSPSGPPGAARVSRPTGSLHSKGQRLMERAPLSGRPASANPSRIGTPPVRWPGRRR